MFRMSGVNRVVKAANILGLLLTISIAVLFTQRQSTALGDVPSQSHRCGKSLADWQALWLSWFIGDTTIAPDDEGNADDQDRQG